MAASPPVSVGFSQAAHTSSVPAIVAIARGYSTGSAAASPAASASSPPGGPDTPGSVSSNGSVAPPPVTIRPVTSARPPQTTTGVGQVARRNMASVLSPSSSTQLSMTSKEWVIPPRPKPGRKPATDTPPTKRKAQNRAAQRAFRERRAARVGELEEQLDEQREEYEKRELGFQDRIRQLEAESENLRARCQWLEGTLEKERMERIRHGMQAESIRNGFGALLSGPPVDQQNNDPPPPPPSRPSLSQPSAFSISHLITPPEEQGDPQNPTCGNCSATGSCSCAADLANTPIGCGNCTLDSRCACLESMQAATAGMPDLKRPSSPSSAFLPEEKRHRSDVGQAADMEMDFTAMFSKQSDNHDALPFKLEQNERPAISVEMRDDCGFCKDGTYCVCADTALVPTPVTTSLQASSTSLTATAPRAHQQQQTQTPPPSDDDIFIPMEVTATGAIKLPPFRNRQQQQQPPQASNPQSTATSSSSKCGPNGPGTCAQCLRDPISGLFCRSLAASFQRSKESTSSGAGCCGGSSSAGGCCKQSQPQPQPQPQPQLQPPPPQQQQLPQPIEPSKLGVSISCADAYKTLASHRHFDAATSEIGDWLPRLKMAPVQMAGREPMEVEAASIMSVLKGFDIRFGRGE